MGVPSTCTLRVLPVFGGSALARALEHPRVPVGSCARWNGGGRVEEEEEGGDEEEEEE